MRNLISLTCIDLQQITSMAINILCHVNNDDNFDNNKLTIQPFSALTIASCQYLTISAFQTLFLSLDQQQEKNQEEQKQKQSSSSFLKNLHVNINPPYHEDHSQSCPSITIDILKLFPLYPTLCNHLEDL